MVVNFLKKNIFSSFGTPETIINDGGKHYCNRLLESVSAKYGVKNMVTTPFHPQTSEKVEVSNRELKRVVEMMVNSSRTEWSQKFDDAL